MIAKFKNHKIIQEPRSYNVCKIFLCISLFTAFSQVANAEQQISQEDVQIQTTNESQAAPEQTMANMPEFTEEQKKILESLPPETLKQLEEAYAAAQQASDAASSERMLQEGKLNFDNAIPELPQSLPYVNELEAMKREQRETLQLKQQIEAQKLRSELLKLQGGAAREGSSPYVISLTGINKQRKARIMLPGYGEMTVKKGDKLPDGWEITDMTDSAVIAVKEGNRIQLPFYARPK